MKENVTLPCEMWPPTANLISDGFALIERHTIRVESIYMSQDDYVAFCQADKDNLVTQNDEDEGVSIWGAEVDLGDLNPNGEIYLVGEIGIGRDAKYTVMLRPGQEGDRKAKLGYHPINR